MDTTTDPNIDIDLESNNFPPEQCDAWDCCFGSNSNIIGFAAPKGVIFWDLKRPRRPKFCLQDTQVACLELSESANTLVTGTFDGFVRLWDLRRKRNTVTLPADCKVDDVHISADEEVVVTCTEFGECKLWNVHSQLDVLTISQDEENVWMSSLSRDKNALATCFGTPDTNVWDTTTGSSIMKVHQASMSCTFDKNGQILLLGHDNGVVRICDPRAPTHTLLPGHELFVGCCAFVPHSDSIITGDYDGFVKLWDLRTLTQIVNFLPHPEHSPHRCRISRCGTRMVTCVPQDMSKLWELTLDDDMLLEIATYDIDQTWFWP